MDIYYDLHIHSCLSPCCDDDMTPWNLVGMARLKGLDVIALTDHNSALNLPDAMAAGRAYGVEVLPGMEIASREDVHVLAYFPSLKAALEAGEAVYAHLPDIANSPALFGNQIIMKEGDRPGGTVDKLLINATDLSLEQVATLVAEHGGVAVPAHINRGGNGMLGALGMMPPLPDFPIVEVTKSLACPECATKGRFLLRSSDAHRLEDIHERVEALEGAERTAGAVLGLLRTKGLA